MANDPIHLLDIDDFDPSHGPVIRRLTAAFGIEDGVGCDGEEPSLVPSDLDHLGLEFVRKESRW